MKILFCLLLGSGAFALLDVGPLANDAGMVPLGTGVRTVTTTSTITYTSGNTSTLTNARRIPPGRVLVTTHTYIETSPGGAPSSVPGAGEAGRGSVIPVPPDLNTPSTPLPISPTQR